VSQNTAKSIAIPVSVAPVAPVAAVLPKNKDFVINDIDHRRKKI
jgi:hypothetical protein